MIACSETVYVCYNDSTVYQNITVFNKKDYTTILATIELSSYDVYKASFVVEYDNGVIFTTNEIEISKLSMCMHNIQSVLHIHVDTYDIQDVSVINITNHGICLGLQFINYSAPPLP